MTPAIYAGLMRWIGADVGLVRFVADHLRVVPGTRVLDLGCGPGRLCPHVPGAAYVGLDIDAAAIAHARRRYPAMRFILQDATVDGPPGPFDIAVLSGLLHHLDDDAAQRTLALVAARLRPGGRLITLDGAHIPGQHPVARWLLELDRGRHVRTARAYCDLVGGAFADAALTVRTDLLRVPYTHAIVEARKA